MSKDMENEAQDPNLERLRKEWDAPAPSPKLHQRVLDAYDKGFDRAPWWKRCVTVSVSLPVTAAVAIAAFLLAWFASPYFRTPTPSRTTIDRYELVSQPRFIVVSQGEHP
jgi:hypothetical protein